MHVCTQINLSDNQLCGLNDEGDGTYDAVGIGAIADALRINASLTDLNLESNQLGPEGGVALAEALRVNASLTVLNLYGNQLDAAGGSAIADALRVNASLMSLDLLNNSIGAKGGMAFADALRVNTSLTNLDIGYNEIGEAGGVAIADALRVNASLTKVLAFSHPPTVQPALTCSADCAARPWWQRDRPCRRQGGGRRSASQRLADVAQSQIQRSE